MAANLPPVPQLTAAGFTDPVWARWLQILRQQIVAVNLSGLTVTAPLVSSGGVTPNISIPAAAAGVNGYLAGTDWTTFNSKQATIAAGTGLTLAGTTLSVTTAPYFQATLSADQSITAATATKVLYNTKTFDNTTAYDAVTNRRFTPLRAGVYRVQHSVQVSSTTVVNGQQFVFIYKNGAPVRSAVNTTTAIQVADLQTIEIEALVAMNGTTDYLEGWVTLPGTVILVKSGATLSFFEACWMAP